MNEEKILHRIKAKRKENGLTQTEFANKVGVSLSTVVRWEQGKRSPNTSKITQIAKVLNTSVEYLMGLKNEDKSSQLFNMIQQTSDSDISPDKPFTAGIDKKNETMTFRNGEQEITVPYSEKTLNQILQIMFNNDSSVANSNNNP